MAALRHLALRCRDMEKTREFYQTAFGWELVGYRTGGQALDLSDGEHNITLIQQPAECDRPVLKEGDEYIHFGVIVEDAAACLKRLRDWGAECATESIKEEADASAGLSFKVLDPDGNVVDVTGNKEEWLGVSL